MLMWLSISAILLYAFIWMAEALEKRQERDRKKTRRQLKSKLSSVTWDEATDSDQEPLHLRDWESP